MADIWILGFLVLLGGAFAVEDEIGSRYFYIYEWPESVVDSWPKAYTFSKRLSLEKEFKANDGAGELIDGRKGLHHTHQYSLFSTFLARLRESKLRTLDPSKASLFFVPYDIGMDSTTRSSDGALAQTRCPRVGDAYQLLQNSTYFQRNLGADHFMLNTINQMMLFYLTDECREFFKLCQNCVKLGIDSYEKILYKELSTYPEMSQRWMSIPFPSNYHYNPHMEDSSLDFGEERWYHIAYIGSDMVTARKQKELRIVLRQECHRRADPLFFMPDDSKEGEKGQQDLERGRGSLARSDCLVTNMDTHDSMTSSMFYEVPVAGETGRESTHPYALATLCLMPGGDFPTRKGVLDALLAGCIPVAFQESTATSQWPWHWGSVETARSCMHLASREAFVENPRQSFDELISLAKDASFVEAKRRCLHEVGHRMQYNLPGAGSYKTVDAVDVVLSRLLF